MNFDAFEKKVKDLGVLGIVVTKDGKEIGKKLWMNSAEEMYILPAKFHFHSCGNCSKRRSAIPG